MDFSVILAHLYRERRPSSQKTLPSLEVDLVGLLKKNALWFPAPFTTPSGPCSTGNGKLHNRTKEALLHEWDGML